MIIYVVKKGDTIYKIANEYGVSAEKIIELNELENPDNLVVGQTIVIIANFITKFSMAKVYIRYLEDIMLAWMTL